MNILWERLFVACSRHYYLTWVVRYRGEWRTRSYSTFKSNPLIRIVSWDPHKRLTKFQCQNCERFREKIELSLPKKRADFAKRNFSSFLCEFFDFIPRWLSKVEIESVAWFGRQANRPSWFFPRMRHRTNHRQISPSREKERERKTDTTSNKKNWLTLIRPAAPKDKVWQYSSAIFKDKMHMCKT